MNRIVHMEWVDGERRTGTYYIWEAGSFFNSDAAGRVRKRICTMSYNQVQNYIQNNQAVEIIEELRVPEGL